ncbi:hypothetical protein VB773_14250 [Haloarculaceae archaeon H-GB2-1]|nr:hypothetical protein [Haloarculaceae archaeon H-GB1-1]MEA5408617.1 hypothetical protein [Haloarculaceae archaeon H-GB2-1]
MTISFSSTSPEERSTSVEPALDDLQRKQDSLFRRLELGFESRRDVLLWCHDASLRTLGQVPDSWFAELFGTRYRVAALLADSEQRAEVSESVESDGRAGVERGVLADDTLVEACRQGMSLLAEQAAEYTNSEEPVDPTAQSFLAMRPAVEDLADRQRLVLERALGVADPSIDSRADVREWVRDVVRATDGNDQGFGQKVLWSPFWLDALRGDPSSASFHLLLADDLLRPMNAALRQKASAATEQASKERTNHGAFET